MSIGDFKPSQVLRRVLNNITLFGVTDTSTFEYESVKVEKVYVGAIPYFKVPVLNSYIFMGEDQCYVFSNSKDMTSGVEVLLRGHDLSTTDIKYFNI